MMFRQRYNKRKQLTASTLTKPASSFKNYVLLGCSTYGFPQLHFQLKQKFHYPVIF